MRIVFAAASRTLCWTGCTKAACRSYVSPFFPHSGANVTLLHVGLEQYEVFGVKRQCEACSGEEAVGSEKVWSVKWGAMFEYEEKYVNEK